MTQIAQRAASMRSKYNRQMRFLAVGGTCFALTVVLNFALKWTVLSSNPTTSMIVATTVASVVSYYLNKKWTFSQQGAHNSGLEMILFAAVCGIGILLNSAPVYVSRYVIGLETPAYSLLVQETADFIAGPILGTALAMVFRWWAMDKFVFPKVRKTVVAEPAGVDADGRQQYVATVTPLNTGEIRVQRARTQNARGTGGATQELPVVQTQDQQRLSA
ncbi:GtrA family protein [Kocuria sp.]|uniref:GtrA family protein n=1 Tax=Kocuria sp. TaxID=1871328 RepID=UPI0026E04A8B|nr:GtrA family protein [Kocuria sp.]MDO5618304.1 GtrA family protein [Kocuria sp.]